jgi:uncharacterized delta-60 repeat protein
MKRSTLFIPALLISIFVHAQPGSLDLSFDTDGIVTTDIGGQNDEGNAIAIQSDGKILVAGKTFIGSSYDFTLARYNTDGSLDNSFDLDGKAITDVGNGYYDLGLAVAIQSNGKILVAGAVADSLFNFKIALVRYNTDGGLDNTFDSDGIVTTAIGTSEDLGCAVAVQADGKILVAGYTNLSSMYDFALVRYNIDGSLDTSFDSDGIVTTIIGGVAYGYSVALQPDGKIIVAGATLADFVLARYNTNGSLDNSFDTDGKVTTHFTSTIAAGSSVAIQADGKIVLGGESGNSPNKNFTLVRYNTDGSLDNSFDTDGKVTTDFAGANDRGQSVAIQSDGKILLSGFSDNGTGADFALACYNTDGSLDNSFDTDGKLTTPIGFADDKCYSIAIQPDGKILMAGFSLLPDSTNDFTLVRYNYGFVGIEEASSEDWIVNLYPNPVSNQLSVDLSKAPGNLGITVADMTGRTVLLTRLNGAKNKLDLTGILPGLYIVQITDGKLSRTLKIIKD